MLNENERVFLERRTQLQRWWPWAGAALLAAVAGLWGYLLLRESLLVHPWALMARIEAGTVSDGTLTALALMGCIGFLTLGIVMLAVIALLWASMRNERRLLDIIRKLRA
jgi:hypothetical protein